MLGIIHKKRKKKSLILKIVKILVLIFIIVITYYTYNVNVPISKDAAVRQFVVLQGDGSTVISHKLKDAGFIKSPVSFQMYVWKNGIDSKLKPGDYMLSENMTIPEISEILYKGNFSGKEFKTLTFREGWTNKQYAEMLEAAGYFSEKSFFDVIQKKSEWWDDYSVLDSRPRDRDLEGYLFPNTHDFYVDTTAEFIVETMVADLDKKITEEMREEIKKMGMTIHEILTLASIIEKEVRTDESRTMVADIFYKRLNIGMALQADSTVNYITGKNDPSVTFADLEVDNPYNTYKYKGLPPGPICNPGLAAIKAAIYPKSNDYWYFLTTNDGQVIYSKTFEEHVANKNKYLK